MVKWTEDFLEDIVLTKSGHRQRHSGRTLEGSDKIDANEICEEQTMLAAKSILLYFDILITSQPTLPARRHHKVT